MGGGGDLNRLPPLENTALGVTAGTIEVAMLQPMLYCKNATQQGLPFTLNPAVLYRGIGMSVINMSVLTGLQFPLTGAVATAITGGANRDMSSAEKISAGFAGGALSGIVCAPMELVMIQQQRFGANLSSAASRVVQEFGAGSLFRGLTMSMGREGLFTAGYLGLGPVFAGKLKEANALGGSQGACDFAGAAGAGMIAATLSHPMDTIKTCMQGDIEQKTYGTLTETASTLYHKEGGVGRFFRGWSWRTTRMICAIFLLGQCKTLLGPVLFPQYFVEAKTKKD